VPYLRRDSTAVPRGTSFTTTTRRLSRTVPMWMGPERWRSRRSERCSRWWDGVLLLKGRSAQDHSRIDQDVVPDLRGSPITTPIPWSMKKRRPMPLPDGSRCRSQYRPNGKQADDEKEPARPEGMEMRWSQRAWSPDRGKAPPPRSSRGGLSSKTFGISSFISSNIGLRYDEHSILANWFGQNCMILFFPRK